MSQCLLIAIIKTKKNLNLSFNNVSISYDYVKSCGANNCPQTKLQYFKSSPTEASIQHFYGCLIAIIVLSMIISLCFMDNLQESLPSMTKINCGNIGKGF